MPFATFYSYSEKKLLSSVTRLHWPARGLAFLGWSRAIRTRTPDFCRLTLSLFRYRNSLHIFVRSYLFCRGIISLPARLRLLFLRVDAFLIWLRRFPGLFFIRLLLFGRARVGSFVFCLCKENLSTTNKKKGQKKSGLHTTKVANSERKGDMWVRKCS